MKPIIRRLALAALIVSLVIVVIISSRSGSVKKESPPMLPDSASLETPIPVVGEVVQPSSFDYQIPVTGVLAARHRSMLSSESGGRVKRWIVEVGESLGEGEALLELDDELAQLNLKQAEAGLASAQVNVEKQRRDIERFKLLRDQGSVSRNDFESAELGLKGAEAAFAAAEAAAGMARRNLKETRVKIPFKGKLTGKLVDAGQLIGPGTPIAEVVQIDPICLNVGVGESEVVQIRPGMEAEVKTLGWKDRSFKGRVHAVAPAADQLSRQFPVEIRLDNPRAELIPGMAASAEILVQRFAEALVVPANTVFTDEKGHSLYTISNSKAQLRLVETGHTSGARTMISGGIQTGDTVVIVGQGSLKPDQRVTLTLEDAGN